MRSLKRKIVENINSNRFGFWLRAALVAGLGWIYFRDVFVVLIMLPLAIPLQFVGAKRQVLKKERILLSQFRDLLIAVSSSISAGTTLEGGFKVAPRELAVIWNEDCLIIRHIGVLVQKLSINISIQKAISDMAVDLKMDECERFAEVVTICKFSGGNMVNAVRSCASSLTEKLDALYEIDSILEQRRLERNILVCVPHCMLIMLMLMSPDYINLLYTTAYGRAAAVASLLFSGIAWVVSEKIIDVKV